MGNLFQNKPEVFEEHDSASVMSTPLFNNNRKSSERIYIMLNSGRVKDTTARQTPLLPFMPCSPNSRLIRETSKLLKTIEIRHSLINPNGDSTIIINSTSKAIGGTPERYLVKSRPFNDISYVHVIVLYSTLRGNYSDQVNISFVANTPFTVLDKLIHRGIVDSSKSTERLVNHWTGPHGLSIQ